MLLSLSSCVRRAGAQKRTVNTAWDETGDQWAGLGKDGLIKQDFIPYVLACPCT
jgi:hypothetical protein